MNENHVRKIVTSIISTQYWSWVKHFSISYPFSSASNLSFSSIHRLKFFWLSIHFLLLLCIGSFLCRIYCIIWTNPFAPDERDKIKYIHTKMSLKLIELFSERSHPSNEQNWPNGCMLRKKKFFVQLSCTHK